MSAIHSNGHGFDPWVPVITTIIEYDYEIQGIKHTLPRNKTKT